MLFPCFISQLYLRKGIHAREWISPAVTTYFIEQLTAHATQNNNLLDDLDWYFMPVHNPDGYVFTWEHVSAVWLKSHLTLLKLYMILTR